MPTAPPSQPTPTHSSTLEHYPSGACGSDFLCASRIRNQPRPRRPQHGPPTDQYGPNATQDGTKTAPGRPQKRTRDGPNATPGRPYLHPPNCKKPWVFTNILAPGGIRRRLEASRAQTDQVMHGRPKTATETARRRPKTTPGRRTRAQQHPKTAPRTPKTAPPNMQTAMGLYTFFGTRGPPGSLSGPRGPTNARMAQDGHKDGPKTAPGRPKKAQDEPNTSQDGPTKAQNGPPKKGPKTVHV